MSSAGKTVLVVDDEPLIVESCAENLEGAGYTVLQATNARDALNQLREHKVDAVFLDIIMPDKDGIETLLEMKKIWPKLTVFAMSGGGRSGLNSFLDVAKKFGAAGTLKKPFGLSDMLKLLGDPQDADRRLEPLAAVWG